MRLHYAFSFHTIDHAAAAAGDVDPTLALMGSQGWEIRGIACLDDGTITVALQRPLGEDVPLPDAPALSAKLAEPLAFPRSDELECEQA